jgi:hypothetical protein
MTLELIIIIYGWWGGGFSGGEECEGGTKIHDRWIVNACMCIDSKGKYKNNQFRENINKGKERDFWRKGLGWVSE